MLSLLSPFLPSSASHLLSVPDSSFFSSFASSSSPGGVLVGRVKKLGEALSSPGAFRLSIGELIVPLCSLTAIPLKLHKILSIHGDQVQVEGEAVIFSRYAYAPIPSDFSLSLALAAIDVSRLLPQGSDKNYAQVPVPSSSLLSPLLLTLLSCLLSSFVFSSTFFSTVERYVKQGDTVLIVGCGKAGLTAISTIRRCSPSSRILAVDVNEQQLEWARRVLASDAFNLSASCPPHLVEKVSATEAKALSEFVVRNTEEGRGADIVLSCVNVSNAEAGCVIATRQGGTVVFFSMATNFSRACLATDGMGKVISPLSLFLSLSLIFLSYL
jgi:L-erythro-3,5-diaminohexanoate dehydrogenase